MGGERGERWENIEKGNFTIVRNTSRRNELKLFQNQKAMTNKLIQLAAQKGKSNRARGKWCQHLQKKSRGLME